MTRQKILSFTLISMFLGLTALQAQTPAIHYLKFNEGSGTTTMDEAIPGLAGVAPDLHGSIGWTSPAPAAQLGTAAIGVSGIQISDYVETNAPLVVSGDWTIEFWYWDNGQTGNMIIQHLFGDAGSGNFRCFREGPAGPGNVMIKGPLLDVIATGGSVFQTWTHIAFVCDNTNLTIQSYVNGVANTIVPQSGPVEFNSSNAAGLRIGGFPNNAGLNGSIDEFRFWNQARSGADILALMNTETGPAGGDDISVDAITAPSTSVGCTPLTGSEVVSVRLLNAGSNTIAMGTTIPLSFTLNANPAVMESLVLSADLLTGQTTTFSFATPADLSALGAHSLAVQASWSADGNAMNDTQTTSVFSGHSLYISTFPWLQSFDQIPSGVAPPLGWDQSTSDGGTLGDRDWNFSQTATPTPGTGPSSDHTGLGGNFAFVNDTGDFAGIQMTTPCIDLTSLSNPTLSFWMHSRNAQTISTVNENFLSVDVISFPGGTVTPDALGPIGHLGSGWVRQTLNLSAFNGSTIQLVFRASSNGGGVAHDIAIDDVGVFEPATLIGQPAQANLAELDINTALNANLDAVDTLAAGPFLARATTGDTVRFIIRGEPSQPIVMLNAPLNTAAASYPGIGQLDIGGAVNAQGIPAALNVFADGSTQAGLGAFFVTNLTGTCQAIFPMPPGLPPGSLTTFQAVVLNTTPNVFGISNAVELFSY